MGESLRIKLSMGEVSLIYSRFVPDTEISSDWEIGAPESLIGGPDCQIARIGERGGIYAIRYEALGYICGR
jgi:hypothetical protein